MAKWISLPHTEGISSRQAHTDLPENTYEREMGKLGFGGPASHLYHQHPPTNWQTIKGPLKPRAFNCKQLTENHASPFQAPLLLSSQDIQIQFWHCHNSMTHLVKNADGDELLFIHRGSGDLYCDFGHLAFSQGDYLLIPKGVSWRIQIYTPIEALMIEATQQSFKLPEKGLLGQHAIFDNAVLDIPRVDEQFNQQQDEQAWQIHVKRLDTISEIHYPFNPLDAIGWHGNLMPVRLNWRDIRPVMSHRYHIPPSVHTTFMTESFLVSTFVPRPMESDPNALRVPFYHSNDDYDEIIFYHQGEFFSRDNIDAGMITLHPSGIPHGPHPKAYEAAKNYTRKQTDEVAVMIDSRLPLVATEVAHKIEDMNYVNAWKLNKQKQNNKIKK